MDLDAVGESELRSCIEREGVILYEKYENFCSALENLKDIYKYQEPYDNVILTGLTGLFEICFEQAWESYERNTSGSGF